nr:hypothetical protein [Tanacetum cinerariifolium]
WKQYGTLMRQTKNLMDINIDALYNILKQNQGDVNDALGYKKKAVVVTSDPLALVAEKTKVSKCKEKVEVQIESEGSDDEDISDLKKIAALLAKAFNRKKYYDKLTNNNLGTSSASSLANKKPEYVKSVEKKENKKADEKKSDMSKVKCYNCKKEGHFAKDCKKAKVKDYNYYKTKMLLAKKDIDEQVLLAEDRAWMESSSDSDQEINANMVFMAQIENVKHVVIDIHTECQAQYAKLEEERYEYMIIYSFLCDNDKQHRKKIDKQEILFDKMSRQLVEMNNNMLRLQEKILEKETKISDLEGCVSNKDAEIEKCLERLNECENKLDKIRQMNQTIHMIMPSKDTLYNGRKGIGFENPSYFEKAKDLRPSLYDEKVIGLGYTLMFLIHLDEDLQIEKFKRASENKIKFAYDYGNLNASYVNEKIKFSGDYFQGIINPDFEKIDSLFRQISSLKPYVPTVILEKIIIDLEDEVVSLLKKEKANLKTIESLKSKDLDTFSSVRRPKHSGVIWKKKVLSNTSNVDLFSVSHLKMNKDVKRYSRKDLLSCNNSHLRETSSTCVCNDVMNVSCNYRLCDSFNENNLFIFDDESVRIYPVGKMPFRKKPRDSMNVRSKSNLNKFLRKTVHRWLPKMQPLVKPVAKWIPRVERQIDKISKIVHICLWIIDLGCSKHMTGNHALLKNFVEKFLGTVRFGNNDFAVIAGYGDVVIGSMTIKKVYYVEGLGHNLFSVGKYCDKGLEVAFRKSTNFVQNEDGVDLLTGLLKMKFEKDHLCSACEQGKIHRKHHKSKTAFASNNPLYLLHMDLCGLMRVESINGKRYVLVVVDDYSRLELGLSNLNEMRKSLNPTVSQVSKTSKKDLEDLFHNFYDEYFDSLKIMKSSTTNVETFNLEVPSNEEEVFHESFESFQEESSSSSLNNDEVRVPSSNTQLISNNMIPNVDEASTSHNPYPHEKKWTKDHPLHKIIGDPKSSVRTRGQLAKSCLFSCLLSFIEPANVAEALRDADWVSPIQDELDQFARLKVWRLVPRPEGKTIIKTKWIFKNKKDESS